MKKKSHPQSESEQTEQPSSESDYVPGQVSGSLFPDKPAASGSLSSLFSAAPPPPAASVMFIPPPKLVPKPPEQKKSPAATKPGALNQRKKPKSAADQRLDNRENSLLNADEEESSKTGKKAKRKAAAPDEDGGGEDMGEKRKIKRQRMAEERIKQKRTVFVGNLPASCTKKTLQTLFRDKGAIESIRFRSVVREDPTMPRKLAAIQRKVHPKKQNINAYVVFKDEEAVTNALERNGMEIEKNMHIRVDRVNKHSSHDNKRSIFVGNLPYDMTELSMRQHFEECGNVEAVRLIRDKATGMGKGFGYVLFENADSVQLALKLNSSELEGRAIRVKRSVKKEKVKKKDRGPRGPRKTPAGSEGRRGDASGPRKGVPAKGGFKGAPGKGPHKNRTGQERSSGPAKPSSFKGEMATPGGKPKKVKGEMAKPGGKPKKFKGEMAKPGGKSKKTRGLKKKKK